MSRRRRPHERAGTTTPAATPARARPRRSCARYGEQLKQVQRRGHDRPDDRTAVEPRHAARRPRARAARSEVDLDQLRKAIEAARALLPLVERRARPRGGGGPRRAVATSRWPTRSSSTGRAAPPAAAEGEAPPTGPGAGAPGQAPPSQAATRPRRRRTTSSPASPAPRSAPGASGCPASSRAATAAGTLRRAPAGARRVAGRTRTEVPCGAPDTIIGALEPGHGAFRASLCRSLHAFGALISRDARG